MKTRPILAVLAALTVAACLSCSSEDGGPGPSDTTPPTITSVSPADGEDDVGLIERVEITFSEPMDASTINDETITVAGRSPGGIVGYDAETHTATVIPDTLYTAEAEHTVTVSTGVTDVAGNALTAESATTFETGVLDCEHLVDYLEPNDDAVAAAPVETNGTYNTLAICGDDEDFFVFDVEEPVTIDFHVSFRRADGIWSSFVLMRNDTSEPFFTRGWPVTETGDEKTVSFSYLPGTYRVRYSGNIPDDFVLYDLELSTGEPCPDDAYEDNDWYYAAVPITEGNYPDLRGCPADGDYFAIDLTAGQGLTLTVGSLPVDAEKRMEIFGPNGDQLAAYQGEDDPADLNVAATEDGIHRIHVRFWSDAAEYTMDLDVSE